MSVDSGRTAPGTTLGSEHGGWTFVLKRQRLRLIRDDAEQVVLPLAPLVGGTRTT